MGEDWFGLVWVGLDWFPGLLWLVPMGRETAAALRVEKIHDIRHLYIVFIYD